MSEPEEKKAVEEYFLRSQEYTLKYGPKTITLCQIGSFYEVYGYKHPEHADIQGSLIEDFSHICDLKIAEKKSTYKNYPVYMAGFGTRPWQVEKYKQLLLEHQYTVVVLNQVDNPDSKTNKKKRVLEGVYSPGTFIPEDTGNSEWNNHMVSIWIKTYPHKHKTHIVIGIAILNILTHDSYIMEYEIEDHRIQATTFDDLERVLSIYSPKEVILISDVAHVKEYVPSLQNMYIHQYDSSMEIIQNAEKQVYCDFIVSRYFGPDALSQCVELIEYPLATQSFCVLIHFLEEHNSKLCELLKLPKWENNSIRHTKLANHTLKQLNIIVDADNAHPPNKGNKQVLHSVHNWTNKCQTRMGSRAFFQRLTHPIFDAAQLELEYSTIEQWMTEPNRSMIQPLRKELSSTYDMHNLLWLLTTRKLHPQALSKLHQTVKITEQIWTCIADMKWTHEYLNLSLSYREIHELLLQFLQYLDDRFIWDVCATNSNMSCFEQSIIRPGMFSKLDELLKENERNILRWDTIWMFLEQQMNPVAKKGDTVKVIDNDKRGISFQMTKLRCDTIQKKLKNRTSIGEHGNHDKIELDHGVSLHWKDFVFQPSYKNGYMDIRCPLSDEISGSLQEFRTKFTEETQLIYLGILEEIEKTYRPLLELSTTILSKLDIIWNNAHLAIQYNYCRPRIDTNHPNSYVDARGLRHVLIEQIQQNETYVPNDVSLGRNDGSFGILLFGTNAVGKTSLMRAIGIAVILAQSGMFVPCDSFLYHPYRAIYSRILNQDNLFKGLSTFAVEMSELRVIQNYCDEYSLILGDEICSGTESTSALCIVMASLIRLHERKSSFLLATHFHEIVQYPELEELKGIRTCHLSVSYDEIRDCLVYERTLQEGAGNCNYGLEVCKSLHMDPDCLEKAYEIRRRHFPEFEGSLSYSQTRYNVSKIKGKCEKCGESIGEEIHHIQEQHTAKENGFIGSFHKNHSANLMSLCEDCHLEEHADLSPLTTDTKLDKPRREMKRRKKTTSGYHIYAV
jgi:DNA mismatch repair protein MutS